MAKKPRKQSTSVRYYLVRDFNFRMGNLHRLSKSTSALDDDVRAIVKAAIQEQMTREKLTHEIIVRGLNNNNLAEYYHNNSHLQTAIRTAIQAAEANKHG